MTIRASYARPLHSRERRRSALPDKHHEMFLISQLLFTLRLPAAKSSITLKSFLHSLRCHMALPFTYDIGVAIQILWRR